MMVPSQPEGVGLPPTYFSTMCVSLTRFHAVSAGCWVARRLAVPAPDMQNPRDMTIPSASSTTPTVNRL